MFSDIASWFGVKTADLLAAFFGALVSLPFIQSPYEVHWKALVYKTTILGCGILSATYVGPLVVYWTDLEKAKGALIFLTGVFFMSFATAIHRTILQTDLNTISEVLKSWMGSGPRRPKE